MLRISIRVLLCGLFVAAAACADLKEVRDYAAQSSQLTAYKELTNRWVTTHEREGIYVNQDEARSSVAEGEARKALQKDLLKIHTTVGDYFAVLGRLAGDDAFSVSSSLEDLGKSVKTAKTLGFDDAHVDAYTNISKIVSNWILGAYQQRTVQKYVEDGNDSIRLVLVGMKSIARSYRGTFNNEVGRARYLNLTLSDTGQDQILRAVARAEFARIRTDGLAAIKQADALVAAIESISKGHLELYDKRSDIGGKELVDALQKVNKDLQAIRKSLASAKE